MSNSRGGRPGGLSFQNNDGVDIGVRGAFDATKGMSKSVMGFVPAWIWCLITAKQLLYLSFSVICGFIALKETFKDPATDGSGIDDDPRKTIQILQWIAFGISGLFALITSVLGADSRIVFCDKSIKADVFFRHLVISTFALLLTFDNKHWNSHLFDKTQVSVGTTDEAGDTTFAMLETTKYHTIAAPMLAVLFWVDVSMTIQKGFASMVENLTKGDVRQMINEATDGTMLA